MSQPLTAAFYDPIFLKHYEFMHPERPQRLEAIRESLESFGMLNQLTWPSFEPASQHQITAVHSLGHYTRVQHLCQQGGGRFDADTYANEYSFEAAVKAAGAAVAAVDAVLSKRYRLAVALVRPPGHHATPEHPMGFCLFNNIAIAARHAVDARGLARVMIVDWDVHHGNGTQDIFYQDSRVLFFSTHQYPFYPGSGHWREIGAGAGEGLTVNVPLPAGTGDAGYARVWAEVLAPVVRRFEPQLILISAGFDAHWRDPLAAMRLTLDGYDHLARELRHLAEEVGAPIAVVLEGGYDLDAVALGMLTTLRALQGQSPLIDCLGPGPQRPDPDLTPLLTHLRELHRLT